MDSEDNAEKGIRFGCGFVLGLVFAVPLWLSMSISDDHVAGVMIIAIALAFGFGALHFRDSFWRWFSNRPTHEPFFGLAPAGDLVRHYLISRPMLRSMLR